MFLQIASDKLSEGRPGYEAYPEIEENNAAAQDPCHTAASRIPLTPISLFSIFNPRQSEFFLEADPSELEGKISAPNQVQLLNRKIEI